VDDADRRGCYGRFMSVHGMRYDVAIIHDCVFVVYALAVEDDVAGEEGVALLRWISDCSLDVCVRGFVWRT